MKYCQTCGKEIHDDAEICPYCGCRIAKNKDDNDNGMAIAALVLAFLVPIVGFILGIVGLSKYRSGSSRGMCIAAVILPLVDIFIVIMYFVLFAFAIF